MGEGCGGCTGNAVLASSNRNRMNYAGALCTANMLQLMHCGGSIHMKYMHVPSQLSEETSSASPPVTPTDRDRAANFNWNNTRNDAGLPGTSVFTNLGARYRGYFPDV